MTLQNLTRRKSRTILTVLGVVVGCCAIVTMMSIGFGVQNSQQIMLEGMGDLTLIQVYSGGRKDTKLDDDAIRKFQNIANLDVAVGKTQLNNVNMTVYAGDNDRYQMQWVNVVGINKDAMEKFGFQLLEGSYPKQPFEVLAGQYAAYNLMDTLRPEGSNTISRWDYMYSYDPNTGEMTENDPSSLPDPYMQLNGQTLKLELFSYDNYDSKKYQEVKVTGIVKEDYNKDYSTSEGLTLQQFRRCSIRPPARRRSTARSTSRQRTSPRWRISRATSSRWAIPPIQWRASASLLRRRHASSR